MDMHPINVVILEKFENDIDELANGYLEILNGCRKKDEKLSAIKMIIEESMEIKTKTIFTSMIQHLAELIDKKE